MRNQVIPQVAKFRYLGLILQEDGEIDGDVNHRIQASWFKLRKATKVICDRKVPDKVKGNFIVLLFGQQYFIVVNVSL